MCLVGVNTSLEEIAIHEVGTRSWFRTLLETDVINFKSAAPVYYNKILKFNGLASNKFLGLDALNGLPLFPIANKVFISF